MMKKNFLYCIFVIPSLCIANPTYDVTQGAIQNNSALCGYGYNPNCSHNKGNKQPAYDTNVRLSSRYGAIAQSIKTGGFSSSMNKDSEEEAIENAIEKCESIKGNGKCTLNHTIRNSCQSLGMGTMGKSYKFFYASNGSRNKVEGMAMNKCRKSGAKNCHILMPEECSLPVIPH